MNTSLSSNTVVKLRDAAIFQQDRRPVLEHVHLTIAQGEFTYLIGKTGSGKTSLLKTLYGALPLLQGVGEVVGFDLSALRRSNIHLLRRKLGIVFQDFNLLADRSAAANLEFVLRATGWRDPDAIARRIAEALESVNMGDKASAMPFELSGGEQQRLVIARALLNDPPLLIADEPTGNLDPETSDDVLTLMRNLAKQHNSAVLCATHDYRIIQNFPARIVRVQHGRLVDEEGVPLR
ncbi:MAG: cell division ATP-binding protein FtsE [Saprospiraceae bacterium]